MYIKKASVEEEVSTSVHHTFYDRNRSWLIRSAIELYAQIYFICYCITQFSDYLEQTIDPKLVRIISNPMYISIRCV